MKVYAFTVEYANLQDNLDAWLRLNPSAEIVQVVQSTSVISTNRIYVTMTIFYRGKTGKA